MIKNVLFDMDGTIVNSEPGIAKGIAHALSTIGMETPDISVIKKCIGPPFAYSFPNTLHVKEEDYPTALKAYHDVYDDGFIYDCYMYKDIDVCIKRLYEMGYSISLTSSKPEHLCKKLLDKFQLTQYFTDIVGSSIDKKIDRKVEVINELFNRCPYKKREESVLIGDTIFDVDGAKEANVSCIGITYGFGTREDMMAHGAITCFDSPLDIVDFIRGY